MDLTDVSESISVFVRLHDLREKEGFQTALEKVRHGAQSFGLLSSSHC